ncbi:MAG: beta-ketoacyl-ACP synthase II [Chloroflexota bacterium]
MSDIKQGHRVVITGLGAISPLGTGVNSFWEGLCQGRSGIRRITQFDANHLPCQIAGEVPDFDPHQYLEPKEARRLPRSVQMAVSAAAEALQDANLPVPLPEPERSGLVFGTGIGGLDVFVEEIEILRTKGLKRVNPFTVPLGLPNTSAYIISKTFRCLGPNKTIVTACATGTQVVGEAADLIRKGAADIVIAGGTEALINDFAIGGFCAMRSLPIHFNDHPEKASRPFDARREGFVYSEGAGVLILESLEHARERGGRVYAEVAGHASSADGYHLAALDPQGAGASRAMRWALQDANLPPEAVEYINAHGTSTEQNDIIETLAIKSVFGEHARRIPISSNKSMIGHAMGASGALEAISTTLTILYNCIPPTINHEFPDPECDLDYVPNQARYQPVKIALSNSFGLGGQNACLVLKAFEE